MSVATGSCWGNDVKFDGVSDAYKRVSWAYIAINGSMFLTEMRTRVFAGSLAH